MSRPSNIVAAILFATLVGWSHSAVARGGHGGFHGGGFGGAGFTGAARVPAYVIIDVAETTDAQSFKTLVANSATTLAPFGGHTIVDSDTPAALDGAAPQRLVIIAFDSLANAQAWKDSPSFKEFDAARGKTVKSRAFIVEGVPNAVPVSGLQGNGRHMRYDPKPFEEIIKRRNQDLDRIKDICKGC
jgi:uncharacterized protein (DUF1330 family)